MSNYLNNLKGQYKRTTFKRKIDYIDYNFGKDFKNFPTQNSRILEIGPGMGECLEYLNRKGFRNIDVIDSDKGVLKHVANNFKISRSYLTSNLDILREKIGQYDLIILIQVLEHIPVEKEAKAISLLYSHLKKDGKIFIVVPNANNPLNLTERYGDLQHYNAFTTRSLLDLVEASGIRMFEFNIKSYEIPPYSLINLVRIVLQKVLHTFLRLVMIANGGVFFSVMTPNIVLSIKKKG